MPKDQAALAGTTADQVRSAYYAGPAATNVSLWIREMYLEPPELIVQDDANNALLKVSYSVDSDGQITFGTGQPIKVEYVNTRAGSAKPIIAFAAATEERYTRRHLPAPPTPKAATVKKTSTRPSLHDEAEVLHQATIVDAAISAGKILPKDRPFYIKAMAQDPKGTKSVLAVLAPGVPRTPASAAARSSAKPTADEDLSWFDSPVSEVQATNRGAAQAASTTAKPSQESSWFSSGHNDAPGLAPQYSIAETHALARSEAGYRDDGTDWFDYPPGSAGHQASTGN